MTNQSPKISVVVGEDHHVTMHGLVSWLEQTGQFSIKGNCSVRDALVPLVLSTKPDVVLLDLHMPGNCSLEEVLTALTASGARVIIFTAENRAFYVKLALKFGASAFLLKSEPFNRLADVIRQVQSGKSALISDGLLNETVSLSEAEEEILNLISGGMKYDEIAQLRHSAPETVRKQCNRLLVKLNLGSREELISWAVKNGYGMS